MSVSRSSRLSRGLTGLALTGFCMLAISSGCSSESSPLADLEIKQSADAVPEVDAGSNAGTTAEQGSDQPVSSQLVGVWLGASYFDEAAFAEKLNRLPQEERESAMEQARYFGATVMAISFKADGSMVNQVEILPESGAPHQTPEVSGTWKVVSELGDSFVVETVENFEDGKSEQSQRGFQMYDRDHFTMQVPMNGILDGCDPVMVFERQNLQAEVTDSVGERK